MITWNLKKLKARDMSRFLAAAAANDMATLAEILALCCESCPPTWGDPGDPETFLNLSYFGEFKQALAGFSAAAAEAAKN